MEKFNLLDFIAYLMPGLLVEALLAILIDFWGLVQGHSIWSILSRQDALRLGALGLVLFFGGYVLSLLVDIYAHRSSDDEEERHKTAMYDEILADFDQLGTTFLPPPLPELRNGPPKARNEVVDALFYRNASAEQWARQNWSWSFYEAMRNLAILFIPAVFILAPYLLLAAFYEPTASPWLLLSLPGIGFGIAAILTAFGLQPLCDQRDRVLRAYHRQRLYFVFGLLFGMAVGKTATPMGLPGEPK